MLEQDAIFENVEKMLNQILDHDQSIKLQKDTCLLGKDHLVNSITAIKLVTLCNEYYGIDLLEDDLFLECLDNVEKLVTKIRMLTLQKG